MNLANNNIVVRIASWEKDREHLRAIREKVFIEEQGAPLSLEWDGEDEHAAHVIALTNKNQPIGTARLLSSGQIGRMAVLPEKRNKGIGSAMLEQLLQTTAEKKRNLLFLNAQTRTIEFHQRKGFICQGEVFMEAGIPHQKMIYQIPQGHGE